MHATGFDVVAPGQYLVHFADGPDVLVDDIDAHDVEVS